MANTTRERRCLLKHRSRFGRCSQSYRLHEASPSPRTFPSFRNVLVLLLQATQNICERMKTACKFAFRKEGSWQEAFSLFGSSLNQTTVISVHRNTNSIKPDGFNLKRVNSLSKIVPSLSFSNQTANIVRTVFFFSDCANSWTCS